MRLTDDGYISTEVELPREGSRVQYRINGCDYGRSTFRNNRFWSDVFGSVDSFGGFGVYGGFWRYLDTPPKEKRDSGHPKAPTARSSYERKEHEYMQDEIAGLEAVLDLYEVTTEYLNELLADRNSKIEHLNRLLGGGVVAGLAQIKSCPATGGVVEVMTEGGEIHRGRYSEKFGDWVIPAQFPQFPLPEGTLWRKLP